MVSHWRNLNLALPSIDSSHQIRPDVYGFQAYGRTLRDVTDKVDENPVFGAAVKAIKDVLPACLR